MTLETDGEARPASRRPLRVLQVVQRFFPELGGTETHVAEVTRRLVAVDDIDVTVLATDRSGTLPRRDEVDGVRVVRRRSWPRDADLYLSPGVWSVITGGDWDVVHFQGVHTFVPIIGMAAARRAGLPYVLTFHSGGHSAPSRSRVRALQWRAITPLLRGADRLIAVSRFERSAFSASTGIEPGRFTVIPNGGALPPVPEGLRPVPGRIVSSGRLEKYKGHHRVIEALPLVQRDVPGAHLVVLGGGAYEPELRALADRLGVAGSVTIKHLPPADRAAMATELASAAVMAAMSSYEAHPVAIMEAVAIGLPVVGADVAGTGDLVEDGLVTGVPHDAAPAQVAAALVEELRASATLDGPRPLPEADLPTWDACAAAVADVYRDIGRSRGLL
ncbi:glycosyltransferase involved in cell wall biosynthesis [Motilibacter peucedani]|uniref:Glycosyltransferase involved in cell wall biosynthesis n=1 Tax=Motilibacter peucedani TaxID=598650 RepID=A0A420XLK8_9ACTN|nr:glycosyltransferase family 4 protein [Motilibacter peucedani]RKS71303.1 glycosyltransferase involved in cell wall biosynthesis [Motilibacter peucedani]